MLAMPRTYSRLGAAAALVIAVLVSACTAGSPVTSQPAPTASPAPAGPPPPGPPPAGPPPVTIAGYYAQRLTWQLCDMNFECARLYVPFDYSRPAGPRFSL